jgi:acetylglutamate kinase
MSNDRAFVLYLDDHHAADALFVQSLARSLARVGKARFLLVHGSGEHGRQVLEGQGIFRHRVDGILPVETPEEHALVERSLRQLNRKITSILTEAVVSSVGIIGSDRGLLVVDGSNLMVKRMDWLVSLIEKGVIPVIASYASEANSERMGEVALHRTVAAIVKRLSSSATAVAFTTTNLPGVMRGGKPEPEVALDVIDERWVADLPALGKLVSQNIRVLLTNSTRLSDPNGPSGTLLRPAT